MLIQPSPDLKLSSENWQRFLDWAPFKSKITQRALGSFDTSKIIINGVSYIARANGDPTIISAQARVFYKTPGQDESSYHVNFMPDASTLLCVFRLVGKEVVQRKYEIDKQYVMLIQQPRYGFNNLNSLEVPGGLIDPKGKFGLVSWEKARTAALREFTEESVSPENHGVFPTIRPSSIRSLGTPIKMHPAITDECSPFYVIFDMRLRAFHYMTERLNGSYAGNKAEAESTRVAILPLREAYNRTLMQSEAPSVHVNIARYIQRFNMLSFE